MSDGSDVIGDLQPNTAREYLVAIWGKTQTLEDLIRRQDAQMAAFSARMDRLAGNTNGEPPGPASVAGLAVRMGTVEAKVGVLGEDLRRLSALETTVAQNTQVLTDHRESRNAGLGRWWMVGLFTASALINRVFDVLLAHLR